MVDVNCKYVGPDDGWTKVPYHHHTLHSIVHSPSVTTVETSNLFLPLYSLTVENCDDEDEDPTESPTVLPSCSDESTKPDPQYTIATHCIPKKLKKPQKKSTSKSIKATFTSSPSTKQTSTYTQYGFHFKKCLVTTMNKKFKKNEANVDLTPSTHPLYPNHGRTKYDYNVAHTERPPTRPICSYHHVSKIMAAVVSLLLLGMAIALATGFTIWEFCFALPAFFLLVDWKHHV